MVTQLIQGQFSSADALDLITQMIQVKIKYHENKINTTNQEEDIKNREAKIKLLQKQLFDVRHYLLHQKESVFIDSTLSLK
jgi:hypothetical protein